MIFFVGFLSGLFTTLACLSIFIRVHKEKKPNNLKLALESGYSLDQVRTFIRKRILPENCCRAHELVEEILTKTYPKERTKVLCDLFHSLNIPAEMMLEGIEPQYRFDNQDQLR